MRDEIYLLPGAAGRLFDPPLSSARVRQLVDSEDLPALRTPEGWRLIPRSEVLRLVEQRRQRGSVDSE